MKTALRLLAASAAMATLAACTDAFSSGDPLPLADAEDAAGFIAESAIDGLDAMGPVGSPAAAAAMESPPITFERTFTITHPCPAGGTITVGGTASGQIDSETRSGSLDVNNTVAMLDCARTRGEGTITFNTPEGPITIVGHIVVEAGEPVSGDFTKEGLFTWERGTSSGSCRIELQITWSREGNTVTHTITGNICGHEVNRTGTHTRG